MMGSSLSATFKRKFIAGLFVSIPAIITILVIGKFFTFVDSLLEPFYFNLLGYYTPGMGFVSAIILIFIGCKMLLMDVYKTPIVISLGFIAMTITLSVMWEKIFPQKISRL